MSVLERLAECRVLPQSMTVDNDPEFVSKSLDEWTYRQKLQLRFIAPGMPQQNAHIESRFDLAYNPSHALALANLRWHGYRSDIRYIVFQCLQHTPN